MVGTRIPPDGIHVAAIGAWAFCMFAPVAVRTVAGVSAPTDYLTSSPGHGVRATGTEDRQ